MIVSFEGIDGSGKSTQARILADRLVSRGDECLFVREPGGTDISERIRELLLDVRLDMDDFAEMLLFSAARAQLVRKKIMPFDAKGGIVVCDRFFDSTVAYQGGGRSVADPDWLAVFQRRVTGGIVPVRTYLIRVSPSVAAGRLVGRDEDGGADRMEQAGAGFFEQVALTYDRLAAGEPDRFLVIDGEQDVASIASLIERDMEELMDADHRRS